ncbi:polysaccharide biosynthesis tyrosine autokinase [Glaciibacter sp. 2TAF33]|uniref:polysaccharide biosynthesis tyrosine autokinase n=1 Tax=Glaciibacter sp. 2TAF33 TaxID=3233015 RepID=UPI003F8E34F4
MDPRKLVRIVRKSWILILAFALVGLAGGAIASLVMPVQYQASTKLYVTVVIAPGSTTGDLVQGNNFTAQKVASYVGVVTSARVLDPVINDLGLDTTAEDLAREVTATVEPLSVVIEIAALAETPAAAADLSSAVASSFSNVVVNQLEKPVDGSASPVKVEVLQPAVAPENPAQPNVLLNLAVGLVLGLVIGVIVALVIGLADRRIHNRADLARVTRIPVLGGIVTDVRARRRPLIDAENARGARAEAFRALRTNVRSAAFGTGPGRPGPTAARVARSLLVTSAVVGEGKTTTALNLAIVLAEGGASVALVDADLRAPRVARYLGIDAAAGLSHVLVGAATLKETLQPWGVRGNLRVLPAGRLPQNPSDLLGSDAMAEMLETLTDHFDYVLVDSPPVLSVTDAAVLSRLTSGTLLVVGSGRVKDTEVSAALEALEVVGTVPVGTVMTMLPARGPDAEAGSPLREGTVSREDKAAPEPAGQPVAAPETEGRPAADVVGDRAGDRVGTRTGTSTGKRAAAAAVSPGGAQTPPRSTAETSAPGAEPAAVPAGSHDG